MEQGTGQGPQQPPSIASSSSSTSSSSTPAQGSTTTNQASTTAAHPFDGPLLTLIRHGETRANVAHILQGSTDSELTGLGTEQARALGRAAARGWLGSRGSSGGQGQRGGGVSLETSPLFTHRPPTRILVSPLGRTRATAREMLDSMRQSIQEASPASDPSLPVPRPDQALAERSFGSREGTRGGKLVAGFEAGRGPREDEGRWRERIRRVARECSDVMREWQSQREDAPPEKPSLPPTVAPRSVGQKRERESEEGGEEEVTKRLREGSPKEPGRSCRPRPRTEPPHVVLVTHGLFISSFLSLVLSPTSPDSPRPPFASNTGVFTLSPSSSPQANPTAPPRLRLLVANDVSHLSTLPPRFALERSAAEGRGGAARGRKGGLPVSPEKGQRTLDGFFAKRSPAAATATTTKK